MTKERGNMKIINFRRTMNTRDLGGYKTKDGHLLKSLAFVRSDALNHLSREELDFLFNNGITTSIDLRTPRVVDKYRSSLRDDNRFNYVTIPIVEGSDVPLDEEKVPELYLQMLGHHETFKTILETMAAAPGGVIYNCSAGKDRTGMVTFILLELAGVPRQVIADDYTLSSTLIEQKIDAIRKIDPSFPQFLGYSKSAYIERLFALFDERYGSIEGYLDAIGLSHADREKLRDKLNA